MLLRCHFTYFSQLLLSCHKPPHVSSAVISFFTPTLSTQGHSHSKSHHVTASHEFPPPPSFISLPKGERTVVACGGSSRKGVPSVLKLVECSVKSELSVLSGIKSSHDVVFKLLIQPSLGEF